MTAMSTKQQQLIHPGVHILVVGLGISGIAAVKFFKSRGARVSVSDVAPAAGVNREVLQWLKQNDVFVETGGHSVRLFTAVDLIFTSPGVPLDTAVLNAARAKAIPVLGELAFAAPYLQTPVVAITGTNGKTTVTTLMGDILRAAGKKVFVGGNIGTPLFGYLTKQEADVVVLEVSSFQLDTAGDFRPHVALLLNISPDHLDRYRSFAAYAAAKFKIFSAQQPEDLAIMNVDDPEIINRRAQWPQSRRYFFGSRLTEGPGAVIRNKTIILSGYATTDDDGKPPETYDLTDGMLSTPPNLQNAAAAVLAARLMGCPAADIKKGLKHFTPLPHRLTPVAEIDGVKYYDDSKATNIGAVQAALAAMPHPVILIAGGRDKGGDYGILKESIRQKVKCLLLIGEAQDKMAGAFAGLTQIKKAHDLEEAVRLAQATTTPGDIVILSPACASFDMFGSFVQRGEVFKHAVTALEKRR